MVKRPSQTACVLLLLLVAAGCGQPSLSLPPADNTPGSIQKVEALEDYSRATLRLMLWWADLPEPVAVSNGIRLYRITYWTTGPDGDPAVASGLAAFPKKGPVRAAVSYQHGTTSNRHMAPSKPTLHEGVLGSAVFAGGGYLFLAPDYIGLGQSTEPHPYLHAETAAAATIDLIKAAKTLAKSLAVTWPQDVYLTGFSQGGHATMAAHRALEAMAEPPLRVKASACVAGAYDLRNLTFPAALEGASTHHSLYLAWLATAYCRVYGQKTNSVLAAPYAEKVAALFDGEHEAEAILAALPPKPRDLFRKEFLQTFDSNQPHWFLDALDKNEVCRWTPAAPVRMYYGEADVDVPPKDAKAAETEFKKRGAEAEALSVGPHAHDESILHAVPKIRKWFDLLAAPA